jgi:hypothetical protein
MHIAYMAQDGDAPMKRYLRPELWLFLRLDNVMARNERAALFVAPATAHGRQPVAASHKSPSSVLVFFYFSLRQQGVATTLLGRRTCQPRALTGIW